MEIGIWDFDRCDRKKKEKGKGDEKPTTKFVVGFTVYIFPYAFTNFVGIIITLSSFSK